MPHLLRRNDGALLGGGTPQLMSSHPTISMERELIVMQIGPEFVDVDCKFTFKNDGKACEVLMGFPDEGTGEYASYEDDPNGPPKSRFDKFVSYVNGKPAPTQMRRDKKAPNLYWHTKTVAFPANAPVSVRDVYRTPVGAQNGANGLFHQAAYILRTGASWKGTIGLSEVRVKFNRPEPLAPLEPRVLRRGEEERLLYRRDWSKETHRVYWSGFAIPDVTDNGRGLRFVRTNWKPTNRSDVYLAFDFNRAG